MRSSHPQTRTRMYWLCSPWMINPIFQLVDSFDNSFKSQNQPSLKGAKVKLAFKRIIFAYRKSGSIHTKIVALTQVK